MRHASRVVRKQRCQQRNRQLFLFFLLFHLCLFYLFYHLHWKQPNLFMSIEEEKRNIEENVEVKAK